MVSIPDDFILRFGSDRDLIFYPTESFLEWAADQVFKTKDEEGNSIMYQINTLKKTLKQVNNDEYQSLFIGTDPELTGLDLDQEIINTSKRIGNRRKTKRSHGKPSGTLNVDSVFENNIDRSKNIFTKTEGTASQIIGIYNSSSSCGLTPYGLQAIADDIFSVDQSNTEWLAGFASNVSGLDFVVDPTQSSTMPSLCYWKNESTIFDKQLRGTGGDYMVGHSTGASWFAIEGFDTSVQVWNDQQVDWSTIKTTESPLISLPSSSEDEPLTLMTPRSLSVYCLFTFNFSASDIVNSDEDNYYDHILIHRGSSTSVDFIYSLPEPADGSFNPGARLELLVNIGVVDIVII